MLITLLLVLVYIFGILGCDSCDHGSGLARRMQPGSLPADTPPRSLLQWGQINFLQTTDTHGWLEGHIKQPSYGADWGDFISFVHRMRERANELGVDLLLIDTGDLHDGNGLSDATKPNGAVSNAVFEELDFDLLTIGNHELYLADIAYETFGGFAKVYGEKYLTTNVQIRNQTTGEWEYIGHRYRYFTTKHGLRIMAFGVLFDFTRNTRVSKVTKAADLIKEAFWRDHVDFHEPIDLFVLIGHNAARDSNDGTSTMRTLYQSIRSARPDIPIQIFGGHTHIRDFVVYDEMTTAIEAGQYCETVGWLSMTGVNSSTWHGNMYPPGVKHPHRRAIPGHPGKPPSPESSLALRPRPPQDIRYSRRYLDWNRLTFAYHAVKSQDFLLDTKEGVNTSKAITSYRSSLNLSYVHGCAPRTYCMTCKPVTDEGSIFNLVTKAMRQIVVNPARADKPRLIVANTGSVRFDLVKGPFTVDDGYIVSPFKNTYQFLPDVDYRSAKRLLKALNRGPYQKRQAGAASSIGLQALSDGELRPPQSNQQRVSHGSCPDGFINHPFQSSPLAMADAGSGSSGNGYNPKMFGPPALHPGYTTHDDFGDDGDDTPHTAVPRYVIPISIQANASFPTDGSEPGAVDVVFLDFIGKDFVVPALRRLGTNVSSTDIRPYMPDTFRSGDLLTKYAELDWRDRIKSCSVGDEDFV